MSLCPTVRGTTELGPVSDFHAMIIVSVKLQACCCEPDGLSVGKRPDTSYFTSGLFCNTLKHTILQKLDASGVVYEQHFNI